MENDLTFELNGYSVKFFTDSSDEKSISFPILRVEAIPDMKVEEDRTDRCSWYGELNASQLPQGVTFAEVVKAYRNVPKGMKPVLRHEERFISAFSEPQCVMMLRMVNEDSSKPSVVPTIELKHFDGHEVEHVRVGDFLLEIRPIMIRSVPSLRLTLFPVSAPRHADRSWITTVPYSMLRERGLSLLGFRTLLRRLPLELPEERAAFKIIDSFVSPFSAPREMLMMMVEYKPKDKQPIRLNIHFQPTDERLITQLHGYDLEINVATDKTNADKPEHVLRLHARPSTATRTDFGWYKELRQEDVRRLCSHLDFSQPEFARFIHSAAGASQLNEGPVKASFRHHDQFVSAHDQPKCVLRLHLESADPMNPWKRFIDFIPYTANSVVESNKIFAGQTIKGKTAWTAFENNVRTTVDIRQCRFKSPPVLLVNLHGDMGHWMTRGGSSPYALTPYTFDLYVFSDSGIDPAQANKWNWHVQWIAVDTEEKIPGTHFFA